MTYEITTAPVYIAVEGKNKVERQVSVVRNATDSALTACLSMKGKVGNAIRESGARSGLVQIVQHCASGSYRSLAEFLAIRLGEAMVISNRSTYEALPDFFEARIYQAKLGKNGGFVTDKKTGALKPGAKLALAMELKSICVDIIAQTRAIHEERKAQQSTQESIEA